MRNLLTAYLTKRLLGWLPNYDFNPFLVMIEVHYKLNKIK